MNPDESGTPQGTPRAFHQDPFHVNSPIRENAATELSFDEHSTSESTFASQFTAAVKKNFRQKINAPVSCMFELLLPILFVLGMVFIWLIVGDESYEGQEFVHYEGPPHNITPLISFPFCTNRTQPPFGNLPPCPPMLQNFTQQLCRGKAGTLPEDDMCISFNPMLPYMMLQNVSQAFSIPSIDNMIAMHYAFRHQFGIDFNENLVPQWSLMRTLVLGGKFRFVPNSNETQGLVAYLNATNPLFQRYHFGGVYDTVEEVESFVTSTASEKERNWAIIHVEKMTRESCQVKLRFNSSSLFYTSFKLPDVYSGGLPKLAHSYLFSGFLSMEKHITDYWHTQVKGLPKGPEPLFAAAPFVAYTNWGFLVVGASNGYFALFLVLSFLYPVSQLVKSIVKEKEMRIREAMKIMGLGNTSFYSSWFATYVIQFLIPGLISTVIMRLTFFPNNDFFAVFFTLWLFEISTISLAGLISTFFSKARVSAIVAPVVYFFLAMPLFLVDNISVEGRAFLLLLSPCACAEAFNRLAAHEISGGMSSADVATLRDDINLLTILIMFVVDTILYAVLALYFDSVLPSEWGTRNSWCFCFTNAWKWFIKSGEDFSNSHDGRDEQGLFENDEANPNPVRVSLRGLRKEFERGNETFTAVNDLHLQMRENEVTVLLGHNGAGKSTALNLITGMLEATDGDCFVYDKSVRSEMSKIRRDLSICPQHNILWDELTCYQHLDFYAALKGISGPNREKVILDMLNEVDLGEKVHCRSEELSGGQKRKLSVAIAFIGGSRFVLLDEPTAGMDVEARRHTWDLIRRMTTGRVVLLTTHFMDEADLLGHTIAIMAKGKLKCQGSPMFLKQNYSVGYKLTMSIDPMADLSVLSGHVTSTIPGARCEPTGSEELAYRLPMTTADRFPQLFSVLERDGESMGLRGFGITVTTLEEVFMRIAHDEETGSALMDRLARQKQLQTLAPTKSSEERASAFTDKQPEAHPSRVTITSPKWTVRASKDQTNFWRQFTACCAKRFNNIKRDRRTQAIQILLPVGCILLSMLLLLFELVPPQPSLHLNATSIYSPLGIASTELATSNCHFPVQSSALNYYTINNQSDNHQNATNFSKYLSSTFMSHALDRYIAIHCNDEGFHRDVIFTNWTSFHVLGEAYALYAKLQVDQFANNTDSQLSISNYPMPRTGKETAIDSATTSFMVAVVILIPFTFIPSTFVAWVVKEKECKSKHLQMVSGMSYYVYWISNLVFDVCSFLVTEILVLCIFFAFKRDEYIGDGATFGATFTLLVMYGLSGVTMAYFLAFFFQEHSSAQNIVMMANFVCGFILVFTTFMLRIFDSTKDIADALTWVFRIVPSFALGEGLLSLSLLNFNRAFGIEADPWKMDRTGWNIVFMAIAFPIFFVLALLLDHPARQRSAQALFHKPDEQPPEIADEEEDVARERRRVEGTADDSSNSSSSPQVCSPPGKEDVVVVRNLRKEYGSKVAVKNLSFGVHKGEVFAFLGKNAAGKTTTISILCGEQLPTNGRGYVASHDVVDNAGEAQQHIGYCPQFDALLELLTAGEHLRLFAGLRGVPSEDVEPMIDELMVVCGLLEHKDTLAGNMSGGNRRKLSVAISLVGGPSVVFLDEPSAGMDPMARRGLWEVIDDVARHSSVVLTTHHLEEVEALAHRVAIMVDGQLMCIGDKTHLKKKYGEGFEMNVSVTDPTLADRFTGFVQCRFPQANLREHRGTKYTYTLPPTIPLSFVFQVLEENKNDVGIADYAVAQTSIESVFLRIVEQEQDDAE